jgi:hypothetical protein
MFIAGLVGRIHEIESEGYELRAKPLTLCHQSMARLALGETASNSPRYAVAVAEALLMKSAKDTSL